MSQAQKKRHALRREHLLAVTRQIMREKGLHQTNVRNVAEKAEVSVGSVLYYFKGFDELVNSAIDGAVEEFIRCRAAIVENEKRPSTCIRLLIQHGIPAHISDDLRIVYEVASRLRTRSECQVALARLSAHQLDLYKRAIESGVDSKEFHLKLPIEVIADNLLALEDGYDLYLMAHDSNLRQRYLFNTLSFASLALDYNFLDLNMDALNNA